MCDQGHYVALGHYDNARVQVGHRMLVRSWGAHNETEEDETRMTNIHAKVLHVKYHLDQIELLVLVVYCVITSFMFSSTMIYDLGTLPGLLHKYHVRLCLTRQILHYDASLLLLNSVRSRLVFRGHSAAQTARKSPV